jgi:hypothetical protein
VRKILILTAAAGASLMPAAFAQPASAAAALELEAPLIGIRGTPAENVACKDPKAAKPLGGAFAPVCVGTVKITNDKAGRASKFVLGVDTLRALPLGNAALFDPKGNPDACEIADPADPNVYGCIIGTDAAPVVCSVDVTPGALAGQNGDLYEAACNLAQGIKFTLTKPTVAALPTRGNVAATLGTVLGTATSTECIIDPSTAAGARDARLDTTLGEPVNVCDAGVVVKKSGTAALANYLPAKVAAGWKLWVQDGAKTTFTAKMAAPLLP